MLVRIVHLNVLSSTQPLVSNLLKCLLVNHLKSICLKSDMRLYLLRGQLKLILRETLRRYTRHVKLILTALAERGKLAFRELICRV